MPLRPQPHELQSWRTLTDQQRAFLCEYLTDFNATRAAKLAGFSESSAAQSASRLLKRDKVRVALAEFRQEMAARAGVTAERHVLELAFLRDEAREKDQYSAAVAAEVNRGKVAGLYVDRHEAVPAGQLTDGNYPGTPLLTARG